MKAKTVISFTGLGVCRQKGSLEPNSVFQIVQVAYDIARIVSLVVHVNNTFRKWQDHVYRGQKYNVLQQNRGTIAELNQRKSMHQEIKPKSATKYKIYNFHIVKLIDHLNLIVAKLEHHTGGQWLVHGTKHRQENQLQCLKHRCRLSLGENIYNTKWMSIY